MFGLYMSLMEASLKEDREMEFAHSVSRGAFVDSSIRKDPSPTTRFCFFENMSADAKRKSV